MLKLAVSIFSGHSVRGASTLAAAGATMNDIMQAADWSTESVFYCKPSHDASYGRTVLSFSGTSETGTFVCFPLILLCVNTIKWLDYAIIT